MKLAVIKALLEIKECKYKNCQKYIGKAIVQTVAFFIFEKMISKIGKYLIILVFLFISCSKKEQSNSESNRVDSLSTFLDLSSNSNLSEARRKIAADKALEILVSKNTDDTITRKNFFKLAVNYYNFQSYKNFKKITDIALEKAIHVKDTVQILRAYSFLGKYYGDLGVNDSAFYTYSKAEKIALAYKDDSELANIYVEKAFVQLYENDYSGCELSSSKALIYLKNSGNPKKTYDAYNLIGISSNEMKSYERAIDYHNRALSLVKDKNLYDHFHLAANSLNNIGVVYQNMGMHLEAIKNFSIALREEGLFEDSPSLYAILIDNLGYSKFKSEQYKDLPGAFYKSLRIRDSLDLKSGIVINKIHLSEYYAFRNDTLKARRFAEEALEKSRESNAPGDLLGALKQLSVVDHKKSTAYQNEYIKISDSIQQAERIVRDKFGRIQFETEEISSEKDKLEEQNRNLLYIFIGTLTIGMLLFVIRTQRAKNRELMLKQAQQKANEDIYDLMINQQNSIEESRTREKKRIAQELHDGVLGRLFGARLNLDSLNRQNSEDAVIKRNEYLTELKNIEQDIREISHDLNREKHALISNFLAILNNLLEEQRSSFEPEVTVNIDDSIQWDELENTAKINLYRIIQECLQNINKYASAKNIHLSIKKLGNDLSLTIADDGVGFSTNTKKKGIGLQNMVSRTQELNGTFDVRSKKGKGATIDVKFPLHKKGE